MRKLAADYTVVVFATMCVLLLMLGCDGGGGSDAEPVGADISGSWSGSYENEETGASTSISADVVQDGSGVTMTTSKGGPPGQSFSGSIDADGNMSLVDAGDGELWTSYTPVTANRILITDYVYQPQAGDTNDVPRKVIDLRR